MTYNAYSQENRELVQIVDAYLQLAGDAEELQTKVDEYRNVCKLKGVDYNPPVGPLTHIFDELTTLSCQCASTDNELQTVRQQLDVVIKYITEKENQPEPNALFEIEQIKSYRNIY